MLRGMSSQQMAEWMAYARIEPFGDQRADMRAALICCAAVTPYAKKGHLPRLSDWMLSSESEQENDDADEKAMLGPREMMHVLRGFAGKHKLH